MRLLGRLRLLRQSHLRWATDRLCTRRGVFDDTLTDGRQYDIRFRVRRAHDRLLGK